MTDAQRSAGSPHNRLSAEPDDKAPEDAPEAVVARLTARAERRVVEVDERLMTWHIWGAGPPVVLLHGGTGSWRHWIRNVAALADRYTVFAADLPGLGQSDLPPEPYDPSTVGAIVAKAIDRMLRPPAPYRLVGFSYGGVAGGHTAALHKARVLSFVTVGGAAFGLPFRGLGELARPSADMDADEIRAVHRHNLSQIMFADPDRIDDLAMHLQLWHVEHARLKSHKTAKSDWFAKALPGIKAPIDAIWGAEDPFAAPDFAARHAMLKAVDPKAGLHLIEGAGHWVMYEAAEAFNRRLLAVLDGRG